MRIGMMVDMYKPYISGVTNFVAINKKFMEEAGHEVFVFTFGDKNYQDDEPNVLRSGGIPFLFKGFKFYFSYSKRARQLLSTMDIMHVQHPFISGPLALFYGRRAGIPVVFTSHTRYDIYTKVYVPIIAGILKIGIMKYYLPFYFRLLDLVMTPSSGMRQVLIDYGVKVPIEVVPNGIDLKAFWNPVVPHDRTALGFSETDVLFVFVGRLGLEKNLWFLLHSFFAAYQQCPQAGLILIGEGPLRQELEEWIAANGLEQRVEFTGLVPYDEMPGYLSMADIFVTPSISEVHPFTVIEAMAAALPVLGIQSPGVGDTVIDNETGFLCQVDDQDQFTTRMTALVRDKEMRCRMGTHGRAEAHKYDIHNTMMGLIDCYQRVIDKSATTRKASAERAVAGERN